MATVARLLKTRQQDMTFDSFARTIEGMQAPTLYRIIKEKKPVKRDTAIKLAKWAHKNDDSEMLNAITSLMIGLDVAVTVKKPSASNG